MSIFGKIRDAIFGGAAQASPVTEQSASTSGAPILPAEAKGGAAGGATSGPAGATAASREQIAAILDGITAKKGRALGDIDWRKSIVDLMKLLELDSSLSSRKSLAQELGYSGDMGDSAAMNVWLHKQVLAKLEASGGAVPADLKKS